MSFKEGFEAVAQIKTSGRKLADAVERIEALEVSLAELRKVQSDVQVMLEGAKASFAALEAAAAGLSDERQEFQQFASTFPTTTGDVLAQAEKRLIAHQDTVVRIAEQLPQLVEAIVEQKLNAMLSQMESRLADRMRDELKDTRSTLRDALEVSSRAQDSRLDEMRKELIAEMPRTFLGRRGR